MDQDAQLDAAPNDTGGSALDLRRWGLVLWKRRWIILGVTVVVFAATLALAMRKPKVYQATVSVVIDPQAPNVLGQNVNEVVSLGTGTPWWNSTEYVNTQTQILKSHDLARLIVTKYNLQSDPRLVGPGATGLTADKAIERAAGRLQGLISVDAVKESRILKISLRHNDAEFATDLANKVTATYIANNVQVKTVVTSDAKRFVAKLLDEAEQELVGAENALSNYMTENNILSVSLENRLNSVTKSLDVFSSSLTEAQRARIELEAQRSAFMQTLEEDPASIPSTMLAESSTIADFRKVYLDEQRALLVLRGRYGPQHPEVVAQTARVNSALEALRAQGRIVVRGMDANLQSLRDTERKYRDTVASLTKEALELNQKAIRHKQLSRDAANAEMVYSQLLKRHSDSSLQEQDIANNIRMLDEARHAGLVEPNPVRAGSIGLGLGLLVALGIVYLLEFLDRSVKSQDDIENVLKLPFLGLVPAIEEVDAGIDLDQYVFTHPKSTIAESCRVIRTNILFCSPDKPLKTILVTSSNPSEGKTINVVNLGITLAQGGQRTLLIDTDMRRPRLHKAFGLPNDTGVSRLIVGETDIDSAIKTTDAPGLFLLPCGPIPPNPAELLQTESFAQLLKQLGERFDRIVLDSPPVHAVTDAAVLSSFADGTVLVVRAGKTTREALARARNIIQMVGGRIAGVVLNDVNLKSPHYASYYYYYQYQYKYHEAAPATSAAAEPADKA